MLTIDCEHASVLAGTDTWGLRQGRRYNKISFGALLALLEAPGPNSAAMELSLVFVGHVLLHRSCLPAQLMFLGSKRS